MPCILAVILARAGSKGLPDKCLRTLRGRPIIAYTFAHAAAARHLTAAVLTTDSDPAKALARESGIEVIDRPAELAHDTATADAAARHAVESWERAHARTVDAVVLLYGNIPVRADGLIDRAVDHLAATRADSVRSVAPVTKQHPDWIHRLDGDRMVQFRPNCIYRRQDLEPLYYHDGAVCAVTRAALFAATPGDHQSFLGKDRRAIIQQPEDAVDIDGPVDLLTAEAVLRHADRPKEHELPESRRGVAPASQSPVAPASQPPVAPASSRCALGPSFRPVSPPSVRIANRPIGRGHPTFVIAEAGVNHDGSLEKAIQLVDIAAATGADAVKFQVFRAADLVSAATPTAAYQQTATGEHDQRAMLTRLELSDDAFRAIARHCQNRGIHFLATPFGVPEVARVAALGAPAVKVASTDLTNVPLLTAAAATGLPLIVSIGAATREEIAGTVSFLRDHAAAERLILLHCVSAYPAPLSALNLAAIHELAATFNVPAGFSDHSTSTHTGAWAVMAGACLIEKHFTHDRSAPGPDHAMSLSPAELADYIANVRSAQTALGNGELGLSPIEAEVRRAAGRSVTTARAVAAGTALTADLLILKRPGTGIAPADLPRLLGRRARRDIQSDTVLTWEMVE